MSWQILIYIKTPGDRGVERVIDRFNRIKQSEERPGPPVELFAPKMVMMQVSGGKVVAIEKPLAYHYIFLRGTADDLRQLISHQSNNLRPLLNRSSENRHAIISDTDLERFRLIAQSYRNTLPFFNIENVDLAKGDKVEIVDGDFAGLQGTFIPKAKSNSGSIVIAATGGLGVGTYDIKASHIRILEFAADSKRAYDHIDAFVPRLLAALRNYSTLQPLTPKDITSLTVFCRRMEMVKLDNHKLAAKLQALLAAAFEILGNREAAATHRALYERRADAITNPWTKVLIAQLQAGLSRDPEAISAARRDIDALAALQTAEGKPLTKAQEILSAP